MVDINVSIDHQAMKKALGLRYSERRGIVFAQDRTEQTLVFVQYLHKQINI